MDDPMHRLTRGMALVVGVALILVAGLVSVEVVLRKVFLIGLSAGTEISSYTLAILFSWGAAFALYERTHVRLDAIIRLLPRKWSSKADLLSLAGLALFSFGLTWLCYGTLADSWRMQSRSMTPLSIRIWIPQALWVLGFVVFSVSCCVLFLKAFHFALTGRDDEIAGLIGSQHVEDEADAEVHQASELTKDR